MHWQRVYLKVAKTFLQEANPQRDGEPKCPHLNLFVHSYLKICPRLDRYRHQ